MRVLVLFLFIVACKNHTTRVINTFSNGEPCVTFYFPDSRDTSNFTIKVMYENGRIRRILTVDSGMYVGKALTFSRNGNLLQIDSLKNPCDTLTNKCSVARTVFYEDGKIAEQSNLNDGKYEGVIKYYDSKGILVKEYTLHDDSIKVGLYKEYDTLGKLVILATYRNDTLIGNSYYFKSNGDTLKYYMNENGQMSFPYKKWLNGDIILVGNYLTENKKKVIWTWYKNRVKIKSKIVISNRGSFVVPV